MNKCKQPKILVIPDVHGRTFWKEAVTKFPDLDTIFLGDYLDHFMFEMITDAMTLRNFIEIIEYARNHQNCQLLLGEHDIHYFLNIEKSDRDESNADIYKELFLDNIDLFLFAVIKVIKKKNFLFSHAPVLLEWVNEIKETQSPNKLIDNLNSYLRDLQNNRFSLEKILNYISHYDGGFDKWSSIIRSDIMELRKGTLLPKIDYNIFGHNQLSKPVIMDNYACLDTRNSYVITENGEIEAV